MFTKRDGGGADQVELSRYSGWQDGDVMYVCHSIRRRDRDNGTAVDIKAHTPLIRFVVDLLVCCT